MASQEKRVKEELKEEEEVVQLNEKMESNNAAEEVDDNSGDDSDMEDDVNEVRHFCLRHLKNKYKKGEGVTFYPNIPKYTIKSYLLY